MKKLSESLLATENFDALVSDCSALIDSEVQQKNLAVRSVFKLVQKAKPGLVERALRMLLPEFAVALDPVHEQFQASPECSFSVYVDAQRETIADDLLQVTDRRIEAANSKVIRNGYGKLRGRAQKEVMQALPRIAALVTDYHGPDRA